jgi:hypothetical protein
MTARANTFFAPLRLCVIKKHGAEGQYRSVMPDQPTSPPHQLRLGRSATKASYQFAMGRSKMPPASSVECWGHSTPDHYKLPQGERGKLWFSASSAPLRDPNCDGFLMQNGLRDISVAGPSVSPLDCHLPIASRWGGLSKANGTANQVHATLYVNGSVAVIWCKITPPLQGRGRGWGL